MTSTIERTQLQLIAVRSGTRKKSTRIVSGGGVRSKPDTPIGRKGRDLVNFEVRSGSHPAAARQTGYCANTQQQREAAWLRDDGARHGDQLAHFGLGIGRACAIHRVEAIGQSGRFRRTAANEIAVKVEFVKVVRGIERQLVAVRNRSVKTNGRKVGTHRVKFSWFYPDEGRLPSEHDGKSMRRIAEILPRLLMGGDGGREKQRYRIRRGEARGNVVLIRGVAGRTGALPSADGGLKEDTVVHIKQRSFRIVTVRSCFGQGPPLRAGQ